MSQREDMATTIGQLLDGELASNVATELLTSIDITRINAHQMAGAVDAVMARAKPFHTYPDALDCCGTGGDGRHTLNISTAAAFVVAARGVQVAKHGNRAVTSKSGSADVLEALGVNPDMSPKQAERVLETVGITFLYAPMFHPGFARVAPIRKAIGKRTIFNLLGPLCNPARVRRQLIGVFAPEYCALLAETCQLLGHERVMVVHGDDGTDELSISGTTHVAQLIDKKISYSSFRPQDAGLPTHEGKALIGGDATGNARRLRDVLDGLPSAYTDAVLYNAAAMLMVADKVPSLNEGVALARSAIARGEARKKLDQLVEASFADE